MAQEENKPRDEDFIDARSTVTISIINKNNSIEIPTASEHVSNQMANEQYNVFESHIEFAKIHVKAALESVCESGQITSVFRHKDLFDTVNNCYPLENIK